VRVLLVDVDSTWANLALMKLSAYHKSLGDEIHLLRLRRKWRPKLGKPIIIEERPPILDCDRAYISCIYPKNRNLAFSMEKMFVSLGMKVVLGGSGIDLHIKLPHYIEHILPDYSLYALDYSMGLLTSGCPRRCPWCIVPEKEGNIKLWSPLEEFLHPRHRKVMLLDNNLLAHPEHKELLFKLAKSQLKVCFTQGLDIRLIDRQNAKLLRLIKYRDPKFKRPRLYFSFDLPEIEEDVARGIETLKKVGIPPSRLLFYMLVGFTDKPKEYTWEHFIEHDYHRFEVLRKLGVRPYVMVYNNRRDIPWLGNFARWVNKCLYNSYTFLEHLKYTSPKIWERLTLFPLKWGDTEGGGEV